MKPLIPGHIPASFPALRRASAPKTSAATLGRHLVPPHPFSFYPSRCGRDARALKATFKQASASTLFPFISYPNHNMVTT